MKRLVIAAAAVLGLLQVCAESPFLIKPFVTRVSDSSAVVVWVVEPSAGEPTIALTGADGKEIAVGARGIVDMRPRYSELFEEYGVDLVVSGHNHIYERHLPFADGGRKPVTYLAVNTSGGTGRAVRPSPVLVGGMSQAPECFATITVAGDKMSAVVKSVGGAEMDSFELIKKDGRYQDEVMRQALTKEEVKALAHAYTFKGRPTGGYAGWRVRKDMEIELLGEVKANAAVKARLNTTAIPAGSKLFLREVAGEGNWGLRDYELEVGEEWAEIELTAPEGVEQTETGYKPAISFKANIEYKGRLFTEVTLRPTVVAGE